MGKCPSCGKKIPDNAKVCPYCGFSLLETKTVKIRKVTPQTFQEFAPLMEKLGEKYEILGILGRGGFSTVLLVEDKILMRKCALKVLSPHFSGNDQEIIERFKREARMYAELEHPNIVPIYDVGFFENRAYILMKFIEGKTLKEIISEKAPLPLGQIISISRDILSALSYMHKKGIIHRDIKPANIIVERTGKAVLADFGLAKRLEAGTHLTRSGELLGTPHFLSPEQAKGDKITFASDIYSYGITLYEMATGHLPFYGDTPLQILWKHVKEPPPPPSKFNPEINHRLERIILKAIEKKPSNRFASAEEMLNELEKLDMDITKKEKIKASPSRFIFLFVLLLIFAGVGGYYFWNRYSKKPTPQPPPNKKQPEITESYTETLPPPLQIDEKIFLQIPKIQSSTFVPPEKSVPPIKPPKSPEKKSPGPQYQGNTPPSLPPPKPVSGQTKKSQTSVKRFGNLEIISNVNSKLVVDNVYWGELQPGKKRIIELKVGKHIVEINPENGPKVVKTVEIRPGETSVVIQNFPIFGIIKLIGSSPWGDIYIDGKFMPSSIIRNLKLKPGEHTIMVKKKGYKPLVYTFKIKPGEIINKLWFQLEKEER